MFKKELGKKVKVFGNISKFGVPYGGIKHTSKKGHTQSVTISPLRRTLYTKTKIKNLDLKTKTNLETGFTKPKIQKRKHY